MQLGVILLQRYKSPYYKIYIDQWWRELFISWMHNIAGWENQLLTCDMLENKLDAINKMFQLIIKLLYILYYAWCYIPSQILYFIIFVSINLLKFHNMIYDCLLSVNWFASYCLPIRFMLRNIHISAERKPENLARLQIFW